MGRMLDALKNLEAAEGATLQVPVPAVAPPRASSSPSGVQEVKQPVSALPTQTSQTGVSIGASFLATLASGSSVDVSAASLPANAPSPQPTAIAAAAATLAKLKSSVPPVRPVTPVVAPAAASTAPTLIPQTAKPASPVAAPLLHQPTMEAAPAVARVLQELSPTSAVVEVQLPTPRSSTTRLEETIKAALSDPRRSVPLEQLARRMRTELRADAGRCWLLADAGEHHDSADLVAHLGPIFASQLGEVLLIDGSLDCALLSAGMNAIDRPGLAQVGGGATKAWQNLIQPTAWQHLFLLPAGQMVSGMPDPTAAWTNLLSQAERRFRLVLIDGGPAADPGCKVLGRLCDATYLVIRLGTTEARQARQAMQQLRSGGARVIGSIATSVPTL